MIMLEHTEYKFGTRTPGKIWTKSTTH